MFYDWFRLGTLFGYIWFSAAGIFHFVIGRSLAYHSVKLVGVNIAGILRPVDIFVSIVIGTILLV